MSRFEKDLECQCAIWVEVFLIDYFVDVGIEVEAGIVVSLYWVW